MYPNACTHVPRAITRVKQIVGIVGTPKALKLAIANDKVAQHYIRLHNEAGTVMAARQTVPLGATLPSD